MIPTAEEVRRMSIDARGTQRPPAPTSPAAQPAPAAPPTLAGVLIIRGMRRAHPTSAPAPTSVVSVSAIDGGERL